ncbi:MAG: hypothetical protein AAFP90_22245, partial [Planctomycetota bacterium]
HRFYSYETREDIGIAMVSLSEALLLLAYGVEGHGSVCPKTVAATREAIHGFLATSTSVVADETESVPALPSLIPLRDAGLPVYRDEQFANQARKFDKHRCQLKRIIESEGWEWHVIHAFETKPEGPEK